MRLESSITEQDIENEVIISDLVKIFKSTKKPKKEIRAVDHVSLDVPKGAIYGLLGPNGAGKSTTVRLLCTLLKPNEGTANVGGFDILKSPVRVREVSGVLPEESNHTLYPGMSAYKNLEYFAKLYGVPKDEIPIRIEELLTFMELWGRKDDKAGELSTGNRQRLALCRALLHRPRVLLLDEPTAALDPIAAKRVRELILSLADSFGQTFFINSHNLPEVQRICDKIAIIDEGKILLSGSTEELRAQLHSKQQFRIQLTGDVKVAEEIAKAASFVESVESEIDSVLVTIKDPLDNNSKLLRSLLDAGVNVVEFSEDEATLEDLYLQVVKGGNQ
ncbi:MAG: ATP-binding cassette domain-containing protein [Candidatus Hodarchaeota archaeon]